MRIRTLKSKSAYLGYRSVYRVILRDLGITTLKSDFKKVCDIISNSLFTLDGESRKDLREKAKVLAREVIMQYEIGNQDAVALEDLSPKITTQAGLLEGVNSCRVDASVAINTVYVLESETSISLIRMTWSPNLVRVFLEKVFDRIYIFDNGGIQVRVFTSPIFI